MSKLWLTFWNAGVPGDDSVWGVTDESDNFFWLHNLNKDPSTHSPDDCDLRYKDNEISNIVRYLLEEYPRDTVEDHGFFESLKHLIEYVEMYEIIEPNYKE